MMSRLIKAESLLAVLSAIGIFSLLYLTWSQWQSQQNAQFQWIFQQQQALHIAENQIARQLAHLACQRRLEQNGITFEIVRCSEREIEVRFPKGKIIVNRNTTS